MRQYLDYSKIRIMIVLLTPCIALLFLSAIPASYQDDTFRLNADIGHGRHAVIEIPTSHLLFQPIIKQNPENYQEKPFSMYFDPKPEFASLYKQIGNYNVQEKIIFVYPIFTQAAYSKNGFYYFYNGTCGSQCLTVSIPDKIKSGYSSSAKGSNILAMLNYSFITDIDIDKNPDILKNYDRIIMMHNEYVTKTEFDAIIHHPRVIFLYPNALYAKVSVNYDKNTITLIRGHGYPSDTRNGFDWKYDNSKFEYNYNCKNWNFYHRGNYTFLNCYPEYRMLSDALLLRTLKSNDPTNMLDDMSNWLTYPNDFNATNMMLQDFDINGHKIPSWVQNPVLWTLNGQISRDEFATLLNYLADSKIIE